MSNRKTDNKLHKLACEMPFATNVLQGLAILLVAVGIILIGMSYIGGTGHNPMPREILLAMGLCGLFMPSVCYALWKYAETFTSTVEAMVLISNIDWCEASLLHLKQALKGGDKLPWSVVTTAISLQRKHERNLIKEHELVGRRAAADAILSKSLRNQK